MSFIERLSSGSASDAVTEQVLIGSTEKDDTWNCCCDLTYKQRFIGFLACFVIGMILSFMSIFGIFDLVLNPTKFAIIYSLGNIFALAGTCFLWGPKKQTRDMYQTKDRAISSTCYLLCIVGTILLCIFYPKWWLILPVILIQFIAMIVYSLSFFPRIRACFIRCFVRGCCGE
jgi:hypothetical protein